MLVGDPSVEAFAAALRDVRRRAFDSAVIRRHAERFGKARFQEQFLAVLDSTANSAARENKQ